jgi:hypothetical protein
MFRVVGRDGMTVNGLAPGRIHREPIDQRLQPTAESQRAFVAQIPLGSFGDPADMAYLVACLCSPNARDITGERIHVDGGYRPAYEPAGRPGRARGWSLRGLIARQQGVGLEGLVAVAGHAIAAGVRGLPEGQTMAGTAPAGRASRSAVPIPAAW